MADEVPSSDEELARELADELRRLRVEDILIQTLVTISSIGYSRLGLTDETKGERELEQSRLAIETMRAVTPVLEQVVPAEFLRDFNQSVANLQLAYARAAAEESPPGRQDTAAEEKDDDSDG